MIVPPSSPESHKRLRIQTTIATLVDFTKKLDEEFGTQIAEGGDKFYDTIYTFVGLDPEKLKQEAEELSQYLIALGQEAKEGDRDV